MRAWLSIGRRPTRPVIFAAARVATARWVAVSLLVALALNYVEHIVNVLLDATTAHASSVWWAEHLINGLLVYPATYVLGTLASAGLVGYFSRGRSAPIIARFLRALRPFALVQIPIGMSSIVFALSSTASAQPLPSTGGNTFLAVGPLLSFLLRLVLVFGGCGVTLALLAYTIALLVNALYVGSGLNRLLCFLLASAASFIVEVVIGGLAALVGAPFGLHLWSFPWP